MDIATTTGYRDAVFDGAHEDFMREERREELAIGPGGSADIAAHGAFQLIGDDDRKIQVARPCAVSSPPLSADDFDETASWERDLPILDSDALDCPIPLSGNFIDALAGAGVPMDAIASALGTSVAALEIGVPGRVLDAFAARAIASIREPAFGLVAGQRMDAERFGLVGFVAMTCATLGEAFQRICRYSRLNWWDLCHTTECGETVTFHLVPLLPGRSYSRFKLDMAMAGLVTFARRFTRQQIAPVRASVSQARPAWAKCYEDAFGCPVEFGREDSITFRRSDLERRLISANEPLSVILEQQADAAMRKLVGSGFVERVRLVVKSIMGQREPSVSVVAAELCLSMRTLQRRLADEGIRFNDLVDTVRREAAEQHLRGGDVSMVEVAFLLGFADPNSFYRAFKRWTGLTPTLFRHNAMRALNAV